MHLKLFSLVIIVCVPIGKAVLIVMQAIKACKRESYSIHCFISWIVEFPYICTCFRLPTLNTDNQSWVRLPVSWSIAHHSNVFWGARNMTYWLNQYPETHSMRFWGKFLRVSKLSLWKAAVCTCGSLYFTHCLKKFRVKTSQQTPQPYRTTTNTRSLCYSSPTPRTKADNAVLELPLRTVISRKLWWWHSLSSERKTYCSPEKDDREREVEKVKDVEWGEGEKQGEWEKWIEWIMKEKLKGDK